MNQHTSEVIRKPRTDTRLLDDFLSDTAAKSWCEMSSLVHIRNAREGANLPVGGRQPEINEQCYA
jgi:hypothetical protein